MEQVLLAKRTDYNLTTARDGREAIEKAIADPPDLILMDATPPNVARQSRVMMILRMLYV